jgi:hypothetical protein
MCQWDDRVPVRVRTYVGKVLISRRSSLPTATIRLDTVWQDRITPVWKRVGGGCHLNRKIDDLITAAGFRIEMKTCYLPGPRPMTYTYQGFAEKDDARASI